MASSYTPLLGLVLPVTGELAGTWGTVWNNEGTGLLDSAIAGTTTLSTDADVTLTTTTGATNQARQAILLCSGARTALRTITAPAQSKIYVVINNTTGGFGVKLVGAGPTTGVTVANGKTAVLVWNGSDFVEVAPATATTATNLAGGAAGSLPYQSGAGATTFLSIGTANRVLTSSGTAPQWSNSLSGLASIVSTGNITGTSLTIHPTLNGKIGANTAWIGENSTATVAVGMYQAGSGSTTIANLNFISSGSTIRGVISCTEESGGDAAYLAFSTRNASASVGERMRITASGNVGIGTSSPGSTLSVSGTASFSTSATSPILIGGTGTTSTLALRSTSGVGAAGADIIFQTGNNGATEAMRILNSGNVGIGTNAPGTKLEVAGASKANYSIASGPLSAYASSTGGLYSYFTSSAGTLNAVTDNSGTAGTLILATGAERMRIDSSGNVGIGTASPTSKLTVDGTFNTTGNVTLGDATTDAVTVNGYMGVGGAGSSDVGLKVVSTALVGTAQYGIQSTPLGTSSATVAIDAIWVRPQTAVAAFTTGRTSGLTVLDVVKGAGSTITNQYGVLITDQTQGTNNFGITSQVSSGSNKWNIYASGTANNYFASSVLCRTTSASTGSATLDVIGNSNNYAITIARSATDAAAKSSAIGVRHWLNSEEPVILIGGAIDDATNAAVRIGGGFTTHNAATAITFHTAADNVTLTGSERMRVDSSGNVGIGTASPVNKLQINGSLGRNAPVTKTGNFTLADTENWIICNGTGTITVTLPAASSWTGREVMIKTIAAFTVVSASSNVVPLAGGAAGTAILAASAGAWATLVSDGTNWIIMQA